MIKETENAKTKKLKCIKYLTITLIILLAVTFIIYIQNPVVIAIVTPLLIISIIAIAILNNRTATLKLSKNKAKQFEAKTKIYTKKESILTECEKYFYDILIKNYKDKYTIIPQVSLSAIIKKEKKFENEYQNELNRIIDFGIFDKTNLRPLLLIEINDKTHLQNNRKERDKKVREICEEAQINIITFWTNSENKENYIIYKINDTLTFGSNIK